MSTAIAADTRCALPHTVLARTSPLSHGTVGPMPNERDEEEAVLDEALEREAHHEQTRDAKSKQDNIERITREDHLDEG